MARSVLPLCLCIGLVLPVTLQQVVSTIPLYLDNPALDLNAARRSKNVAYYGVFELGTPAKQFKTCFDTGSADLWVPSSLCSDSTCITKDRFASNASSTFKAAKYNFQVNYATGSVVGEVAYDTVSLGSPTVTITNQGFGLATDSTSDFLSTSCDGLWGLGFVSLSQMRQRPPFYTMLVEQELAQSLFSVWLSPDPEVLEAGELVLGGTNPKRYLGAVTYLDVSSTTYWAVALTGIAIGGVQVAVTASQAIVDSGSTAILLSTSDAFAVHQVIGNMTYDSDQGVYTLDCGCKCVSSLPWVSFVLQGQTFSLPPTSYIMQNAEGTCLSSIVPGGQSGSVVLGSNFMRQWYSVFVWNNSTQTGQIGLAKAAASPDSLSTSPALSDDFSVALADKSGPGKSQGRKLAQATAQLQRDAAAAVHLQGTAGEAETGNLQPVSEPQQITQHGIPLLKVHSGPPEMPAGTAAAKAARADAVEHGQETGQLAKQEGSGRHSGYRTQQAGPRSEGFVTVRSKYGGVHRHAL